jgi:hypothetical protein
MSTSTLVLPVCLEISLLFFRLCCLLITGVSYSSRNPVTHTQGFFARDDKRREVVVAFQGSRELSDMAIGTTHCNTQQHARSALQHFLSQTAISFLFRRSPMASRTPRPRCTPASSCRTILCIVQCFTSCVASSKSSRTMQWSPQVRNACPKLICLASDGSR